MKTKNRQSARLNTVVQIKSGTNNKKRNLDFKRLLGKTTPDLRDLLALKLGAIKSAGKPKTLASILSMGDRTDNRIYYFIAHKELSVGHLWGVSSELKWHLGVNRYYGKVEVGVGILKISSSKIDAGFYMVNVL